MNLLRAGTGLDGRNRWEFGPVGERFPETEVSRREGVGLTERTQRDLSAVGVVEPEP